jgi:hypothetical protein
MIPLRRMFLGAVLTFLIALPCTSSAEPSAPAAPQGEARPQSKRDRRPPRGGRGRRGRADDRAKGQEPVHMPRIVGKRPVSDDPLGGLNL